MSSSIADSRYNRSNQLQQQQQPHEYAEDKKCRICGFADTKNVNIFSPGKALVTKILTVYPLVLYKNDPLPKNICKKCICNVSIMYNDILRVTKTQSKWINNVRAVQPQHNYIRVLDLIENSNNVTRDSIKATMGEEIHELSVGRLFLLSKFDSMTQKKARSKQNIDTKCASQVLGDEGNVAALMSTSFSMDFDDGATKVATRSSATQKSKDGEGATEFNEIKSLLELNGCSLLEVGMQKTTLSLNSPEMQEKSDMMTLPRVKKEATSDETKTKKTSRSSNVKNSQPYSTVPGPPPPLTVKCRLCPLQFTSLASLATHQIIHMRLCIPKIFQKKYLHKRIRRGRLISVQERKCIRCLNCWRIFVDNKSILEHWAIGECDFYCHICGKEFPQAPKMLREHVPAAHGISYRSSKFHRARLSAKIMMSMVEENPDYKLYQAVSEEEPLPSEEFETTNSSTKDTLPPSTKLSALQPSKAKVASTSSSSSSSKRASGIIHNEDGSVSCHICLKVFHNFKARNSHMRKHKPVYAYGDVVLPPPKNLDSSFTIKKEANEDHDGHKSIALNTVKMEYSLAHTTCNAGVEELLVSAKTNASSHASTTPRGVRTKFVSRRNEMNGSGGKLKVKPLNELQQQKSTEDDANANTASLSNSWLAPPTLPLPPTSQIKSEPIDMDVDVDAAADVNVNMATMADKRIDASDEEKHFTCIPCNQQFPTRLELFRHKRKCRVSYVFTCEYCPQSFNCSADYQLHFAEAHNTATSSN